MSPGVPKRRPGEASQEPGLTGDFRRLTMKAIDEAIVTLATVRQLPSRPIDTPAAAWNV